MAASWRQHAWRRASNAPGPREEHAPAACFILAFVASLTITNLGTISSSYKHHQLVTMKFSMLAIAATAFAGVQGFAPVANPSTRVLAMQVRRHRRRAPLADSHRMA